MTTDSQPPSADRIRFPWPRGEEVRGLAIRMVVRDAVWIAAVRLQVDRWRKLRAQKLPVTQCEELSQLSTGTIRMVEVSAEQLPSVADWLYDQPTGEWPAIALLSRTSLREPADQAAASRLLQEAGATRVFRCVREVGELSTLLDACSGFEAARPSDPLDDLPLRCWGPAWQRPRRRIGLSS